MKWTFISAFAGGGGADIGLIRAGWTPIAACEIEPYAAAVYRKNFPEVPLHGDIRTWEPPCAALAVGGFPCQDISAAGKGAGIEGDRSILWFEFLRHIRATGPRWVIAENVPALRTRGGDTVLLGLEEEGYTCWPLVVGAWAVGAPHRRDRVFILAYSCGSAGGAGAERARRPEGSDACGCGAESGLEDANGSERRPLPEGDNGNRNPAGWEQGAGGPSAPGENDGLGDSEGQRVGPGLCPDCASAVRGRRSGNTGSAELAEPDGDGCGRILREARRGADESEQRAHVDGEGVGIRGTEPARGVLDEPNRVAGLERPGEGCPGEVRTNAVGSGDGKDLAVSGCEGLAQREGPEGKRAFAATSGSGEGATESGLGGVLDGLAGWLDGHQWPARPGEPQHDWEPGRTVVGMPGRAKRLKVLGNGIVPQVMEAFGRVIIAIEEN